MSVNGNENIDLLKENISALNEKDTGFALSMLKQFEKKGHLSSKQMHWIEVLAKRAVEGTPKPVIENIGNFKGVIDLLVAAKANLKYPKIKLQTENGFSVALSLAGPGAKKPGTINITDGGPWGDNKYYGRVTVEGKWEKPFKNFNETVEIGELLAKLASDPAETAAAYGKLTGNCCFCNLALTDEKSVSVGYGPVCAKHFGMPWGTIPASKPYKDEIAAVTEKDISVAIGEILEDIVSVEKPEPAVEVIGLDDLFADDEFIIEPPKSRKKRAEEG